MTEEKVFVELTKSHLACGERGNIYGCPIAIRLKEMFPNKYVYVGERIACVDGEYYDMPLIARQFVVEYDCGKTITQPPSFYMEKRI